ncbi:Nn.00g104770.m01.CDS01 [Neocucurbitaria sp. VM-36]
MVLVLLPFTVTIVLANQISNEQIAKQRKFRYVLEELQIITIWLVKACLLVLYWRIFPVETNIWRRRSLQSISAFCCISFLVVQISVIAWCQPMEAHWDLHTTNAQCIAYHGHTAVTLAFNIPNTILIMLLPVPFIPTPRRLLLAILFILGALVLATGIISRSSILMTSSLVVNSLVNGTAPFASTQPFLHWYTSESTLSIIFANLPFLTSLVVATAPARIRGFSQNLRASSHVALGTWPRSRRGSWSCVHGSRRCSQDTQPEGMPASLRANRIDSTATTLTELPSSSDVEKALEWGMNSPDIPSDHSTRDMLSGRHSVDSTNASQHREQNVPQAVPARLSSEHINVVPKTRLSGGLAEMGAISTDNTEGWPIYWK